MRIGVALVALAIVVAVAYLGRRDLSRPAVVFGVSWFTFVALAQLQLTPLEADWSFAFAAATIGGGLAFVLASLAASGTRPARGSIRLEPGAYKVGRLVLIAVVLMAGGAAAWIYKAHVLGGVPLLSSSPDVVRGRAFLVGGVPSWASLLTDGFYVAFWILIAAARLSWSSLGLLRRAGLCALAAAALFGVALDASRNLVLLAVLVPLVAAYVLSRPASRRQALVRAGAALLVVAAIVGGAFLARLAEGQSGNSGNQFVQHQLRSHSPLLRPFMPVYINGVLPLDASHALRSGIPDHAPWGGGAYSLLSLPSIAYPHGKPNFGEIIAHTMGFENARFWTVAGYQGRAYGDFGTSGVIFVSILLGLMFGAAYRFARGRSGIFPLALIGYVAHYSAYLVYDNLLSFTLAGFYDLALVFAAQWLATWEVPWRARATAAATG